MLRAALLALLCATRVAAADHTDARAVTADARVAAVEDDQRRDAPVVPPAIRYGALSQDDCEAELTARGIAFERDTARGVLAPVRLMGPLHGVTYRTNERAEKRATSVWEIADCRLVLALDDFAAILAEHDIVEVRHYSMYRAAPKSWPDGKIGSQHRGGLALDAARFIRRDGTELDVLEHFKGKRRSKTCGPKARKVSDPRAKELREIICAAVDQQLFNVVLTPNFNRAHRNHFHLDLTTGVKWFMVR